jgi:F0F1-type ATP synthase alpha subunit
LINGSQASLRIGDAVYPSYELVKTRCGFGVLGEVINPLGEFLVHSSKSYRESELSRLFKTR